MSLRPNTEFHVRLPTSKHVCVGILTNIFGEFKWKEQIQKVGEIQGLGVKQHGNTSRRYPLRISVYIT